MVYCNLKGGLGNMLFQIVSVKSLAIDKEIEASFPNLNRHLKYLDGDSTYNPSLEHSTEYTNIYLINNLTVDLPFVQMPVFNFPFEYSDIELPNDNFVVEGFFQSEKYFLHNRKTILEWFDKSESIIDIITSKYKHILDNRTTSVHVRRGDYIKHSNYHHVQDVGYYINSMNELKDVTDLFIVFSDDIAWCRENLTQHNCSFIENEKDYLELYLMSMCENNIIANSSFSWWGAWLNKNENKRVIAPKNWFGPLINSSDKDIIPDNWFKF